MHNLNKLNLLKNHFLNVNNFLFLILLHVIVLYNNFNYYIINIHNYFFYHNFMYDLNKVIKYIIYLLIFIDYIILKN